MAYPDTHEVTFRNKCFACSHDPTGTSADIRKGVEKASKIAPMLGAFMQFAGQVAGVLKFNTLTPPPAINMVLECEYMLPINLNAYSGYPKSFMMGLLFVYFICYIL